SLSNERLTAIVALLKDKDRDVRSTALTVLGPSLSNKRLPAVVALFKDKVRDVRSTALTVLGV
ncbi:hypothetical protein BT67DRAFT_369712, partial [Trichocladium antarcticum]